MPWLRKAKVRLQVKSDIAATLGTQNYARLRFGIGNDFPKGGQIINGKKIYGAWTKAKRIKLK